MQRAHLLLAIGQSIAWVAAARPSLPRRAVERRIALGLKRALGQRHDMLAAPGHGRGVGFNFASDRLAVAWDDGAWCLVFGFNELAAAELSVDGALVARVQRGGSRYACAAPPRGCAHVGLRLVFDDPHHPDFLLDLWRAGDAGEADEAAKLGLLWMDRFAALLRRPLLRRRFASAAA